jgi:hypothetical protein
VHLIAAVSREPDVTAIGQRPGYVSEQETQSLIEFLDPLKPTELPQRHLT